MAASQAAQFLQSGIATFFEYDTPRIVHIRSWKIGALARFVQTCVLAYVVGYVMVYKKGYQEAEAVVSAVTTKVKGVTLTKYTDLELEAVPREWRGLYNRIWDVTDYVVPSQENNALFLMTNAVITPNQTRGECAEKGVWSCRGDEDCPQGGVNNLAHGVLTGVCDLSSLTCVVHAWCPIESDTLPLGPARSLLPDVANFTVLIKNQIYFPKFGKSRTNILTSQSNSYLSTCIHSDKDPLCPVFRVGDIVKRTGQNFSDIAVYGGVINIDIEWNCDLDHDFMSHCRPKYSFDRLDDPKSKIAPGLNYRRSEYYGENKRTLYKTYGIYFIVNVHGEARKFSFIPLMLNLGAGLALLSITTVICDIIVLHLHKNRVYYKDKKYLTVEGLDAWRGFGSDNPNYARSQDQIINSPDGNT